LAARGVAHRRYAALAAAMMKHNGIAKASASVIKSLEEAG